MKNLKEKKLYVCCAANKFDIDDLYKYVIDNLELIICGYEFKPYTPRILLLKFYYSRKLEQQALIEIAKINELVTEYVIIKKKR